MTWLRLSQIAEALNGELHGEDVSVNSVATDSRKVQADQLFWAIKGERFDAHDFVAALCSESGNKAAAALVHRLIDCPLPQVLVQDTHQALARLAAFWREQFTAPLIGLTGSNGKTTVKEMTAAILSQEGETLATYGNLNNDIGVPLTLFRLRKQDFAVIEMGANNVGEIAHLTSITKPNVAILNNAGAAHLEGFGSIEGVSRAKGEIFQGLQPNGTAIINADDDYADYWRGLNKPEQTLTFGMDNPADVSGQLDGQGGFQIQLPSEKIRVNLPLLGQHNALNALAASAAAHAVGVKASSIKVGLESLQPVKGRLAVVAGQHQSTLIDDPYNANPSSIKKAIDVLANFEGRKILVLGDVAEIGDQGVELHQELGQYAKQAGIDDFYGFGNLIEHACDAFADSPDDKRFFDDMDELIQALKPEIQNVTLLAKGSRSMRMERVIEAFAENLLNQGG